MSPLYLLTIDKTSPQSDPSHSHPLLQMKATTSFNSIVLEASTMPGAGHRALRESPVLHKGVAGMKQGITQTKDPCNQWRNVSH